MQGHYLVPQQDKGMKKDLTYKVTAATTEDAEDGFVEAKERLLDVNNWKKYSSLVSAEFRLTDLHGAEVNRNAKKGDNIRIDIPGPGSAAGGGYDWVVIEAIEYDDYPDEDRESFGMRVRPCGNPLSRKNDATAHFFSNAATSTFVAERKGRELMAHYHGRNETANTDTGIADEARNMAVALGGWLGLSDVQWKNLIKGLIEDAGPIPGTTEQ